jgi:hypothetical protein
MLICTDRNLQTSAELTNGGKKEAKSKVAGKAKSRMERLKLKFNLEQTIDPAEYRRKIIQEVADSLHLVAYPFFFDYCGVQRTFQPIKLNSLLLGYIPAQNAAEVMSTRLYLNDII